LIDAGSRFADGAVPEYLVYDVPDMEFARLFLKTCEEGMEKSKLDFSSGKKTAIQKPAPKVEEPEELEEDEEFEDLVDDVAEDEVDEFMTEEEETATPVTEERLNVIRAAFKSTKDAGKKAKVKQILANSGGKLSMDMSAEDVAKVEEILEV
jgi:hypothetical protein